MGPALSLRRGTAMFGTCHSLRQEKPCSSQSTAEAPREIASAMWARPSAVSPGYAKNATPGAQRRLSDESRWIIAPWAARRAKSSVFPTAPPSSRRRRRPAKAAHRPLPSCVRPLRVLLRFLALGRRFERLERRIVRNTHHPQRALRHLRKHRCGHYAAVMLTGRRFVDHYGDHHSRCRCGRETDKGSNEFVGRIAAVLLLVRGARLACDAPPHDAGPRPRTPRLHREFEHRAHGACRFGGQQLLAARSRAGFDQAKRH